MQRIMCGLTVALALACGPGAGDEPIKDEPKPLTEYDWRTPSELDGVDPDSVPGKAVGEWPQRPMDSIPNERLFDPEAQDKGTTSMLLGWGLKPSLHYQDGTCTEPDCGSQPDHCSYFGLNCDDAWHYQARTVNMNPTIFTQEWTGSCADAANSWEPCMMPEMMGNRTFKWRLDLGSCGSDTAQLNAFTQGWEMARGQLSHASNGSNIYWTQTTGTDWDIILYCGSTTNPNAYAEYSPRSQLKLIYGLAIAGGENTWADTCTAPDLPGSNPDWVAVQQQDFVYTVRKHELKVNIANMMTFGNNCTNNATRKAWSYSNVLLHEAGHWLGLVHDNLIGSQYADFDVMSASASCSNLTDRKKNFHPFYREALKSLDTSTVSDELTVWDDDLACFKPFEY